MLLLLRRAKSSPFSPFLQIAGGSSSVRASFSTNVSGIASAATKIYGIHVFHCPDVVGIVAKLSECIASRGGSIRSIHVFVPENKNVFYSRSQFVFDPARWPRTVMENDFLNMSKFFNAEKSILRVPDLDAKYKIAVLASKQMNFICRIIVWWTCCMDGRRVGFL